MSYQMAVRNMKGDSSPSEVMKQLKLIYSFTYQCSHNSNAAEISDVYEAALARRERFLKANITTERCVVFLDEAGLPAERSAALKSIHYYTDHALVGSVMLTNHTLDTAKTNRAIQLLQTETTKEDLFALAKGCILDLHDDENESIIDGIDKDFLDQLRGLCFAYEEANKYCDIPAHPQAYHLRDFIYLCRFLRHIVIDKRLGNEQMNKLLAGKIRLDAVSLIHALRRTFNGISDENFRGLVRMFLTKTNLLSELDELAAIKKCRDVNELMSSNVVETLRDALQDQLRPDEDPNQSHFRHILLIDKSSCENAPNLLFDMNLLDAATTVVFTVSDFPADISELNRSALISRIKNAVETGKTIILVNSSSIINAFFDLVNKHYSPIGSSGAKQTEERSNFDGAKANDQQLYYANISIGSFSRPCVVHPRTKIIVHVPVAQLPTTPLPFLNRFDKFSISLVDVLREELVIMSRKEEEHRATSKSTELPLSTLFRFIFEGADDFVKKLDMGTMFYGLIPQETVAALIMRSIRDTQRTGSIAPLIRRPFHVNIDIERQKWLDLIADDDEGKDDFVDIALDEAYAQSSKASLIKRIREFIRSVNFQLLHYARPESVFLSRLSLPRSYLKEYLRQEHFSAASLIRFLANQHWRSPLFREPLNNEDLSGHKLIIFIRTSADLLTFKSSENIAMQRSLAPLTRGKLEMHTILYTILYY